MLLKHNIFSVICILAAFHSGANGVTLFDMAQGGGPVGFPTTIKDVPREIRIANMQAGYEVYKDANPYHSIEIQSQIEYLENRRVHDEQSLSHEEYCDRYPTDMERCNPTEETFANVFAIGSEYDIGDTTDGGAGAGTDTGAVTPPDNTTGSGSDTTPPIADGETSTGTTPGMRAGTGSGGTGAGSVMGGGGTSDDHRKIHDGPCTPPETSDWYPNKILTTGKYQSIDPAFEKALINNFRVEGKCGTDIGGYTCYGISAKGNPDIDIASLTPAKVEDITYIRYYKNLNIHTLPDYIRGDVMRAAFSAGANTGITQLQKTLGVSVDGKIGPIVISASENYSGDLHNKFWDAMQQYYGNLARQPKYSPYLKGWMNTVKLFRENGCHVTPRRPLYR